MRSLFDYFFFIYLEQGEKLVRQASDAGEKVKSAAKNTVKQAEKQSEGLLDQVYSVLNNAKDTIFGKNFRKDKYIFKRKFSYLETFGIASKHAADITDQAKEKFDELAGKAQKQAEKTKKNVKDTLDL
jgi:vacuolar-type H+-ATPase subunit E/Vma4